MIQEISKNKDSIHRLKNSIIAVNDAYFQLVDLPGRRDDVIVLVTMVTNRLSVKSIRLHPLRISFMGVLAVHTAHPLHLYTIFEVIRIALYYKVDKYMFHYPLASFINNICPNEK